MASQDLSQHVHGDLVAPLALRKTLRISMVHMLIAMLPAAAMAFYRYGYTALEVMAWAGLTAVITEIAIQKLMDQSPTADNFSALTACCWHFLLPATAPWWMVIVGSAP